MQDEFTVEFDFNYDIGKWEEYLTLGVVKKTLEDCKKYIEGELERRFNSQSDPDHRPWRKLKKITTVYKGSGRILEFKRNLSKSFKYAMYAEELIVTSDCKYMLVHQFGASFMTTTKQTYWMWHNLFRKRGHPFEPRHIKIPARPFFGFSKGDANRLRIIFLDNIQKSEKMGV